MESKRAARKRWAMIGAAAGVLAAQWALAHHSLSIYESARDTEVAGIATHFFFRNPHAVVRFDVTDASGKVENWSAETSGTRRLGNAGWDEKTIKPGDRLVVIGRLMKDGSKKMFMEKVVVNGKEWERGRR